MKTHVVPIGNSRGVRIPKALLELCQIQQVVDLSVKGETIIIRPMKRHPRDGWESAFHTMHQRRDDRLLLDERIDRDLELWEW